MKDELKPIDKRKIEHDCASAPVNPAAHELEKRGKTMEDKWFREHEAELIKAARARRKSPAKTKEGDKEGDKPKPKCCGS